MNKTIVTHQLAGGVGSILTKLIEKDQSAITVIELSKYNFYDLLFILFKLKCDAIEFHQPRTFFYSFIYIIFNFSRVYKHSIILHECSYFTLNNTNIIKGIIGTCIRFLLLHINKALGVTVFSVSKFISNSYIIECPIISYAGLFKNDLKKINLLHFSEKNKSAVIWLRTGYANDSLRLLLNINRKFNINYIYVFGEHSEVIKFKYLKKSIFELEAILIFDLPNRVPEKNFHNYLNESIFFISSFDKEGYGLSIFFAMYFGCVVICPKRGGYIDWLPSSNFIDLKSTITLSSLMKISTANRTIAKKILN